jgi:MFS transporter, DHA2 family, multidrug resistance protein
VTGRASVIVLGAGLALLGAIGTAVYRGQVADTIPQGVTPGVARAPGDTLGGAVAVGHELPDPLAADLLDVARDAFTQGLQLAASLSATVAIGAAVLAAALLRGVGAGSTAGPQDAWTPITPAPTARCVEPLPSAITLPSPEGRPR